MTVPKPIALRLATTAAVLWVAMRLAVTAVRASAVLSPPAMLAFTGLVVAATFMDIRITNERILYANLAIRPAHIGAMAVIVSIVLETATTLLFGVIWPDP